MDEELAWHFLANTKVFQNILFLRSGWFDRGYINTIYPVAQDRNTHL